MNATLLRMYRGACLSFCDHEGKNVRHQIVGYWRSLPYVLTFKHGVGFWLSDCAC